MNMKRNPYLRRNAIIIAVLLIGTGAFGVWEKVDSLSSKDRPSIQAVDDRDVVATVNGEPIQRREFIAYLQQHRADTSVPFSKLKENVLQELITVKAIQIEAKKRGLVSTIAYSDFLNELEKENQRRLDAVANKEVIYGPKQYNEQTFYSDQQRNLILKLKNDMAQHTFDLSEGKLRAFYEKNKEQYATNQDVIKLKEIIEPSNTSDSLTRMQTIVNRLKQGESFDQIYKEMSGNSQSIKEETLNETNVRDFAKYRNTLYMTAMKLKAGEVSEIIQDRGGYVLIQCVERTNSGYKSYEDVSVDIKLRYIDSQYEQWISQQKQQVDVKLNVLFDQLQLTTD